MSSFWLAAFGYLKAQAGKARVVLKYYDSGMAKVSFLGPLQQVVEKLDVGGSGTP